MPLDTLGLISDLTAHFAAPPTTESACAIAWGTIIRDYTDTVVPAVPGAAQDAAKAALISGLAGMAAPGAALALFSASFAAYAGALAVAMTPPGTPPPVPISASLGAAFTANAVPGTTHAQAATSVGTAIDLWFRTGLSAGATPWA